MKKQGSFERGGYSVDQNNRAREEYHNNFQKISNNYSSYESTSRADRTNKQGGQGFIIATRHPTNKQHWQQPHNNIKNDQNSELVPYTAVKYFASRLRFNQAKNENRIVLNEPVHNTRQGFPTLFQDEDDYYVKLAEICKYTLVGKFTNTMPRMEEVRKSFILQTQLMGVLRLLI